MDTRPPPFWNWKFDTAIWWEKGTIMDFLNSLAPGRKTTICVVLGVAMSLACPTAWVAAHGVDCAWVDQILGLVGLGAVASIRSSLPAPSGWKTRASVLAGSADVFLASVGGWDAIANYLEMNAGITIPATTLEHAVLGLSFFGGAYGIRDAIRRSLDGSAPIALPKT